MDGVGRFLFCAESEGLIHNAFVALRVKRMLVFFLHDLITGEI